MVATFPAGTPLGVKVRLDDASTSSMFKGHATTSNTLSFAFDSATVVLPSATVPEPTSLLLAAVPLFAALRRHRGASTAPERTGEAVSR